jgi:DNA repair protein RadC
MRPSAADEDITKKVKKACEFMDLKLLDHLIIAPEGKYSSFNEDGLL